MIAESLTIQVLHIISLALKPVQRWEAARRPLSPDSAAMTWLTVFAVVALIIAVILLFWVFANHRRSENRLNLRITELTITNVKLQQENNKLTATNEKLRQENAELYRKQVEVLENIVHEETPRN